MALTLARLPRAVRGALAFLTRLPVGGGESAWDAFRRTPAAFPIAGLVVGALVSLPFVFSALAPLPPSVTVAVYLLVLVAVTGVTHADGLADLADAAAVHERPGSEKSASDRRREVLKDAAIGVGGVLALVISTLALAFGALALAGLAVDEGTASAPTLTPLTAAATVVLAEVGAKTAMGLLASLGAPAHDGLGSQLVSESRPRDALGVSLTAVGACLTVGLSTGTVGGPPGPVLVIGAVAVLASAIVALGVRRWASANLGGVSGDAFGAANELTRVFALHAGVIAWALL